MNDVYKIAVLGKDIYMLYVAEMALDCTILLLTYTLGSPEKFKVFETFSF